MRRTSKNNYACIDMTDKPHQLEVFEAWDNSGAF